MRIAKHPEQPAAGVAQHIRRPGELALYQRSVRALHGGLFQRSHNLIDAFQGVLEGADGILRVGADLMSLFIVQELPDVFRAGLQDVEQAGAVMQLDAGFQVYIAQIAGQAAHRTFGVAEDVHIQGVGDVHVTVGIARPGERRAVGEAQIAHRQRLPVAGVAPVGVEVADGAVLETVFGRVAQVADSARRPSGDRVPGSGAGADVERHAGRRERSRHAARTGDPADSPTPAR